MLQRHLHVVGRQRDQWGGRGSRSLGGGNRGQDEGWVQPPAGNDRRGRGGDGRGGDSGLGVGVVVGDKNRRGRGCASVC